MRITQGLLLLSVACLVKGAQELSYRDDGLNWGGICVTSQRQSPINLVSNQFTSGNAPSANDFSFGTGSNVTVSACATPTVLVAPTVGLPACRWAGYKQ